MAADDPGRKNLRLRTGDSFKKTFMWGEPGARKISDLSITLGSTTATSITAEFTDGDTGKKIVTQDGLGITDGTTMTYVSSTEIELSDAATASLDNVKAVIRGINASAYTDHKAQFKYQAGTQTAVASFDLDDSRSDVGVFVWSMDAATTAGLTKNGVWDWQCVTPDGLTKTWVEGTVHVSKDVSQ